MENIPKPQWLVVLGAGVIGLSTAIELRKVFPTVPITIIAEYFPGDYNIGYTSPWAGGNWCSSANDNGILESFDRITFNKFRQLVALEPHCGISKSPLRMIFDQEIEDTEILSRDTNKIWYDDLVGGLTPIDEKELPSGAIFGIDMKSTFVINTQIYLRWYDFSNSKLINLSLTQVQVARRMPFQRYSTDQKKNHPY